MTELNSARLSVGAKDFVQLWGSLGFELFLLTPSSAYQDRKAFGAQMTNLFITKANESDFQKCRMMDSADTKINFPSHYWPSLPSYNSLQILHLHFKSSGRSVRIAKWQSWAAGWDKELQPMCCEQTEQLCVSSTTFVQSPCSICSRAGATLQPSSSSHLHFLSSLLKQWARWSRFVLPVTGY